MLTNNLRTKIVILSDDREIAITEQQYLAIKADQNVWKYNDPVLIRDADTKETLFDGKIWAIREFRDIKRNENTWNMYVCDYATRHTIHESCNCQEKYWVHPIEFRMKMHDMFPMKYASTLTKEEKSQILKNIVIS